MYFSFDKLQDKGSKKDWQRIVHYEIKSNLQLKFNKMQEGANRILVTSQVVPNWKS